jgi:glycosyltransferase involved in cell wall biosynthesis
LSLRKVRTILKALKPDLLHTHFLTGYGYWGHYSRFSPNLLTVWGDDVYLTPYENALKGWLAKRALRSASAVTGDSVDILKRCATLGADPTRCYEIQWGVDFSVFNPERSSHVREELQIPDSAPVVFSPRSFTQAYYNIDVIIDAVARLQKDRPAVHVIFAGYEGDQSPFREMAARAGLTRQTHFVGRIPHENFADYLVASDVFVSVPSVDATAVSLLEAMACGCAIVVSSLASSLEWIKNGENGLVVPPRDEGALVGALTTLVDDPSLRARYGSSCVEEVRGRADHEHNMQWVLRLYEHFTEGRPLPGELRSIAERELS